MYTEHSSKHCTSGLGFPAINLENVKVHWQGGPSITKTAAELVDGIIISTRRIVVSGELLATDNSCSNR
jgi:hypothetical protein